MKTKHPDSTELRIRVDLLRAKGRRVTVQDFTIIAPTDDIRSKARDLLSDALDHLYIDIVSQDPLPTSPKPDLDEVHRGRSVLPPTDRD
jgi:hypothetical protein